MIRVQFMIIAEHGRAGVASKFDLLGLFDRIFAPAVPTQHRLLVVTTQFVTDDEDDLGTHKFRFYFEDPSGEVLFEQTGQIKLKPQGGPWLASTRTNVEINGLPLPKYGVYHFRVDIDGKPIAEHPLRVAVPPSDKQS